MLTAKCIGCGCTDDHACVEKALLQIVGGDKLIIPFC